MASDLPDFRHANPLAMAKVLVTYMDDPAKIRRAIKLEFMTCPAEHTIRDLRERHLAAQRPEPREVFSLHDGYYPQNHEELAERRNKAFLRALRHAHPERFAIPDLVNGRWDDAFAGASA